MKVYLAFTWKSRSGRKLDFIMKIELKVYIRFMSLLKELWPYHSSQLNDLSSEWEDVISEWKPEPLLPRVNLQTWFTLVFPSLIWRHIYMLLFFLSCSFPSGLKETLNKVRFQMRDTYKMKSESKSQDHWWVH